MRALSDQVPRARRRATLTYRIHPRLSVGAEWNPGADEVGGLVNLVAVTESEKRPALILGTSSDRIGTPSGRAWYATVSKDLSEWLGIPVAPYAGLSYGSFEDETRPIGGVHARLGERLALLVIHDGVNLHPTLTLDVGSRLQLTLLMVDARDPGLAASWSF